jgi:quercetin dioxygenase-like cupin family protein
MSFVSSGAVVTKAADAEVIELGATRLMLLADHDTTDGVVNANRAVLAPGADGPPPHFHTGSAELLFVLGGGLQVLAGDRVTTLDEGDFLLVPRRMPHAFAAVPGAAADVLVLFAPAITERFEYFRLGERILRGEADPREVLESQERFDNHFVESVLWRETRATYAGHPNAGSGR